MSSPWNGVRREPTPDWNKAPAPKPEPGPAKPEEPVVDAVSHVYKNMRLDCIELEELIGNGVGLTEKDIKRLDKAVTVIKVGFKIIKMVLRAHGYRQMKPTKRMEPVQ